jgi:hypothetical protein
MREITVRKPKKIWRDLPLCALAGEATQLMKTNMKTSTSGVLLCLAALSCVAFSRSGYAACLPEKKADS